MELKFRLEVGTQGMAVLLNVLETDRTDTEITGYALETLCNVMSHDPGEEGEIDAFPTPEELWQMTFAEENEWRERFADIPFEDKGGSWQPRYYQDIAVQRTLEAMANGEDRILLTLATGTGKTAIAFQIAWKLFQSRWNRGGEPSRRPRVLFLADRNIYKSFLPLSQNSFKSALYLG